MIVEYIKRKFNEMYQNRLSSRLARLRTEDSRLATQRYASISEKNVALRNAELEKERIQYERDLEMRILIARSTISDQYEVDIARAKFGLEARTSLGNL